MFDEILAVDRIAEVLQDLADIRLVTYDIRWVRERVPVVAAEDGEIFAYALNRIAAASIIGFDAKAPLRAFPTIRVAQNEIPKYKHGFHVPESKIRQLARITANLATAQDRVGIGQWLTTALMDLQKGVWIRIEAVTMAALLDSLVYNENGMNLNVSFGMPSDLKVTPSVPWSTAATATPITDLLTVQRIARQKYGVVLNRVTMSTQAMLYMALTTEFQKLALPFFSALSLSAAAMVGGQNVMQTARLANAVTGIDFEIDDRQYTEENPDGSLSSVNFLPAHQVLFTSTGFDGDAGVFDFGNANVIEAIPGYVPAMIGTAGGEQQGPFSYFTGGDPGGNPPSVQGWSVAAGFPRIKQKARSAVLTVYTP